MDIKRVLAALFMLAVFYIFASCDNNNENNILHECPDYIAKRALEYAVEYSETDTEYQWGGQDFLRSIKIDCSGLVVNCYLYATDETPYYLPFNDASVYDLFTQWTANTLTPKPGDLIFMGDDINNPTHIGLYVRENDFDIYFIDSTYKPEEEINGVSERSYPKNDNRFLSYGRMLLCK